MKMTDRQIAQFNEMRDALRTITLYKTSEQLKKNYPRERGREYLAALEVLYENIRERAWDAVGGVEKLKPEEQE